MLIISSDDAGITINRKSQKQTESLQWERRIRRRKQASEYAALLIPQAARHHPSWRGGACLVSTAVMSNRYIINTPGAQIDERKMDKRYCYKGHYVI